MTGSFRVGWSTWRDSLAAGSVDRKPLAPGSIARDFNVIAGYTDGTPTTQLQCVALGLLFTLETGMRAGEIFGLRASNVDHKNRVAHLPLTKNGQARNVPLNRRTIERRVRSNS